MVQDFISRGSVSFFVPRWRFLHRRPSLRTIPLTPTNITLYEFDPFTAVRNASVRMSMAITRTITGPCHRYVAVTSVV